MNKKKWIIVVLAILVLGGGVFMATRSANGDTDVNVPIFESVPDSVVIYQGNMALVKDEMKIYSGKEVQVILPPQAVTSTVEIVDGGKKIERFKFKSQADRSARGGSLLSWKSPRTGERKITLSYMMQGMSWTPIYIMKILGDDKVAMQYRVGIRNDTDASSLVDMRLVSGEIGSPSTGSGIYYRQLNNAQFKVSAYERAQSVGRLSQSSPYIGATKISAHYTYKLPNAPLEKKGITFVTLQDRKFNAKREYVWVTTTGQKVDIVYTVANNSGQPFAQGLVNVFKNGIFVGSDLIEWTPSGAKGHVTIGSAVDVQAEKTVDIDYVKERGHRKEYLHRMKLTVKNFSGRTKVVKVIDQKYPDSVEKTFSVQPASVGNNTYLWTLTVPPGVRKEVTYSFYSDSRYTNPYNTYN